MNVYACLRIFFSYLQRIGGVHLGTNKVGLKVQIYFTFEC